MQTILEELFVDESNLKTKPSYVLNGVKIFENKELVGLLEELKEETFTLEYKDSSCELRLPIQMGKANHHLIIYETDFIKETGLGEITSTDNIFFNKKVRQVHEVDNAFHFYYDSIDWDSRKELKKKIKEYPYEMNCHYSYKGDLQKSNMILYRQEHELTGKKTPRIRFDVSKGKLTIWHQDRPKLSSDNKIALDVNALFGDMLRRITSLPIELSEVNMADAGWFKYIGNDEFYIKTRI
ncbi:hypothetical protein [Niallia taxi]|uniref:hypothetical protein n=1 Tax=Niallia taxi TaxID=2499688 RepID=UPI0015F3EF52|nr:hypothetical protein [Niallia taxi]